MSGQYREYEQALTRLGYASAEKALGIAQAIEQAQIKGLQQLAVASAYRDPETGRHTARMSRYCAVLAEAAGLSRSECRMILQASRMHDIGKVWIPDEVLLKPGKLDADEWALIKTHAPIGGAMLAGGGTSLAEMAKTIALTHHERWDGSGYPRGLHGEDIPLVGRIAALADVFDALTSERTYKRAWSVEEAVDEIRRQRGRHFDPRLVDTFLRTLPRLRSIATELAHADEDLPLRAA